MGNRQKANRYFLFGFVAWGLVITGAGCDQREKLEVFDEKAQKEAAACGSVDAPPAPPAGNYVGHGLDIDYEKLAPDEGPTRIDQEYAKEVLLDGKRLEQVYYDASLGVPHATWAVCYQEMIARNVGRQIARYQSSARCEMIADCRLRMEDMPIAQDTASGSRLIGQLVDEYQAQAKSEKLKTDLVMSTINLIGARALARRAAARSTAGKAATSSAAKGKAAGPAPGCFAAGTLVHTEAGLAAIETLDVGDRVLARDPASGMTVAQPVLHTHAVAIDARRSLTLDGAGGERETLEVSAEHPLWSDAHGWREAGQVAPGQALGAYQGDVTVREVHALERSGGLLYNLEVAGFHTFFVGRAGVLVHNKPMRAPGPGKWKRVNESMKARAKKYQRQITGTSPDNAYVVGGVKFDGFKDGVLLEAKGPGYSTFIKDGTFRDWFKGKDGFKHQADRQHTTAGGTPIEWHVAEANVADAVRVLLKEEGMGDIRVIHTPAKP